jgi:hypothetical protein
VYLTKTSRLVLNLFFLLCGWNSISSRIIRRTCERPFFGGIYSSDLKTRLINLIIIAENAIVAAISVTISFLNWFLNQNFQILKYQPQASWSTHALPQKLYMRFVILRFISINISKSSPYWYWRTSLNVHLWMMYGILPKRCDRSIFGFNFYFTYFF